jgi:hypothetical protein
VIKNNDKSIAFGWTIIFLVALITAAAATSTLRILLFVVLVLTLLIIMLPRRRRVASSTGALRGTARRFAFCSRFVRFVGSLLLVLRKTTNFTIAIIITNLRKIIQTKRIKTAVVAVLLAARRDVIVAHVFQRDRLFVLLCVAVIFPVFGGTWRLHRRRWGRSRRRCFASLERFPSEIVRRVVLIILLLLISLPL